MKCTAEVIAYHRPPAFGSLDKAFAYAGTFVIDQFVDHKSDLNATVKRGDANADFCMGVGGAYNIWFAHLRMEEHPGPSSKDGLADSTRCIYVCLEAASSWIGDDTEEELL